MLVQLFEKLVSVKFYLFIKLNTLGLYQNMLWQCMKSQINLSDKPLQDESHIRRRPTSYCGNDNVGLKSQSSLVCSDHLGPILIHTHYIHQLYMQALVYLA